MEQKFSEVFDINPKLKLNKNQKIDFVEMKNIESGKRSVVSEYKKEFKGSGSKFERGDTLFARITPCLENGKISRYDGPGTAFGSTEFIVIRGKEGVTLSNFAYYYSTWEKFREFCIQNMIGSSGRQRVPVDALDNWTVYLPSLPEQKKIADLLDSFDSKIELNQKMNETLEEIAKTLFKSWFIDFDPVRAKVEGKSTGLSKEISDLFPDSFEDSELGEIPRGWRIESLSNITSFKNGFAFKSKDWTESGKPVVKIGNVKPLILDIDGCSFISDDIKKYDEYLLSKGDILIGMTGYVGETCLVPKLEKMPYQNQRVGKLIPNKDFFKEFIFSFTRQSNFKKKVEEIAQGSAQQNVSGKDILGLHFVFGNEEILKIFSDSTSDLFKKILLNFEENITLTMLRDTLLPKLISGELQIPDAENLVEEAGI